MNPSTAPLRRHRRIRLRLPVESAAGAHRLARRPAGLVATAVLLVLAGCTSSGDADGANPASAQSPACPVEAIPVLVTVAPWSDVVSRIGGKCAEVTTVVAGSAGDPHDYEPTPGDQAAFGKAKVVVMNGLGYDRWADKALEGTNPRPIVVDAGKVTSRADGSNPHLWYKVDAVAAVAGAVASAMTEASPGAKDYVDQRQTAFMQAAQPYTELVVGVVGRHGGKRYAATEAVAGELAADLALVDTTPAGYADAATNETEPSPGSLADFRRLLADRQVDVLIVNPQTEGAVPADLREAAKSAGIPVVEMTEAPPGNTSYFDWQIAQLRSLDQALSGR